MSFKFSIIIPHRNIPQLLERCLNSIPKREDIQVIVVDDASDNVLEIQKVVSHYNVELILVSDMRGAGYARNLGLQRAKGEWLLFADADDFFSNSFNTLIDKHYSSNADIVYFSVECVYSESLKHSPKLDKRKIAQAKYQSNSRKIGEFCKYFHTEPWGKMIKRDLVERRNVQFDETLWANDYYFSVVSAYYAKKITFDNQVLYIYTVREGSLSFKYSGNENILQTRLNVYWGVQQFFDEHHIPYSTFYRYSLSEYILRHNCYSNIIKKFWEEKNIGVFHVIYKYLKDKIYQYTFGVRQ